MTSRWKWILTALVVTVVGGVIGVVLDVLVEWPGHPASGLLLGVLAVPLGIGLSRSLRLARHADEVLARTLVGGGLVGFVSAVYLVVVVGLGGTPSDVEQDILALSMAAAALAVVGIGPARRSITEWVNVRVYGERHSPDDALQTFGGRMSRAVPMDELLLQLVETLKKTLDLSTAEIWTGSGGSLDRTVSVPELPAESLQLADNELGVVARAHAQGNSWLEVWIPALLRGRESTLMRSVSVAHLGDLLGLIVVTRPDPSSPFTEEEDRVLVELARQVGLALHNVRLDSALQASLKQLEERNRELVASRARIIAAADESRRRIERDLHDGAQQHLVALAVKIGLVRTALESDGDGAVAMVDGLREDVQRTLTELRSLAHGIYPPLLRERGLVEALRTVANRSVLPAVVEADLVGRFGLDREAAVYFCCVEAVQNAGKHAGTDATVVMRLGADGQRLWFEVADNGDGFDEAIAITGTGFVNMRDRLGAFGGTLSVQTDPGQGTVVSGAVPLDGTAC